MKTKDYFTTGEIANLTNEPLWRVREFVDSLGSLLVLRAGLYRLVPTLLCGLRNGIQPPDTQKRAGARCSFP